MLCLIAFMFVGRRDGVAQFIGSCLGASIGFLSGGPTCRPDLGFGAFEGRPWLLLPYIEHVGCLCSLAAVGRSSERLLLEQLV